MAGREPAIADHRLHALRQFEQPDGIGDVAAALAHLLGDLLLGVAEAVQQLVIGRGLLDRVQIRALNIFDDRKLERLSVRNVADYDRYFVEFGKLRRTPATLAGND